MQEKSWKPDVMIVLGILLIWGGATFIFTPYYNVASGVSVEHGVFTGQDLDDLCTIPLLSDMAKANSAELRSECASIRFLLIASYAALIGGIALIVSGSILKKTWGYETFYYLGLAALVLFTFFALLSYHIEEIPVANGVIYRGAFF